MNKIKLYSTTFLIFGLILTTTQSFNAQETTTVEEIKIETTEITDYNQEERNIPDNNEVGNIPFTGIESEKEQSGSNILVAQDDSDNYLTGKYYICDEELSLEKTSEDCNDITIEDGIITESENAIVMTVGTNNEVVNMYKSVEEINGDVDPIPLSGAGFDAQYVSTVEVEDEKYAQIVISGQEGLVPLDQVAIIPQEYVQSQSHYENVDGVWTYFEAIDPLVSTEYLEYPLSDAPSWAEIGVSYFSYDGETFYTSATEINNRSAQTYSLQNENYFQNLPFRSTSDYTSSDYKSYLTYLGYTNSEYYNSTNGFVDAQNLENVNSLLLFAFANHESAYGMSTYSQKCYNFFGRGAYDSNPDDACISYGYDSAYDGILSEAIFLSNMYFDIKDWKFNGDYFGDKSGGMNVYYATDPDWGMKNASHAYRIDKYLGSKEQGKYMIISTKGSQVYTNSSLSTKLKVEEYGGIVSDYYVKSQSNSSHEINMIVTSEGSNYYQVQLITPKNISSGTTCKYVGAEKGSYPNYSGGKTENLTIASGVANFACNYGEWSNQKGYISKSGTTVLNGTSVIVSPGNQDYKIDEEYQNGILKYKFYSDPNNGKLVYSERYNSAGKIDRYYEYNSGAIYGHGHGDEIKYVFNVNTSTGYISSAYKINSSGQKIVHYEYYSGAIYGENHASKIKYIFNVEASTQKLINSSRRTNGVTDRYYEYNPGTVYGKNHGENIKYIFKVKSNKEIINSERKTNGKTDRVYEYYNGTKYGDTHGKHIKFIFDVESNYQINYAYLRSDNNGEILKYYYYDNGTIYGQDHGSKIDRVENS